MRKITYLITISLVFIVLQSANKDTKIEERYRPQFHFTPEKNWMNDPNGLIWINGTYHLFYQHNPHDTIWGYMNWGHAISKDLVHWEHLPIAIEPDNGSKDKEIATAWSGSAIIDKKNVTGLQEGDKPLMLIFYTSRKCGQRLAYSNDEGITWQKYEKNPVIPFDENDDARDPKVFWYESGNKYIMVLWRKPEGVQQGFSFYSSENLLDWQFESHLPGFYECPDLVQLPIENKNSEKRWVLFDGDGSYYIGNFDGKNFVPESLKRKSDYGNNYYATQTWSNIPEEDGRVIQIAWMRGGEYPEMPFKGQMSFPCELTLIEDGKELKLVRRPVKEIEILHRKNIYSEENLKLIPGLNKNPVRGVKNDCIHIKGSFILNSVNSFGFMVRMNQANVGTDIRYDAVNKKISCQDSYIDLIPEDGKIRLEILIDRSSIELFANDGKVVISNCFLPGEKSDQLYLYNTGGELIIEKLDIYSIESMYNVEK